MTKCWSLNHWNFEFGYCLLFVNWCLEFPQSWTQLYLYIGYDPRLRSSAFVREQPPYIFFSGLAGAAFGNKTGYKPGRCDIEGKIG